MGGDMEGPQPFCGQEDERVRAKFKRLPHALAFFCCTDPNSVARAE